MSTHAAIDQNLSPGPADLDSAGEPVEHARTIW